MKKSFVLLVIIAAACSAGYSQKAGKAAAAVGDGSMFAITIAHNGEKVELTSTQFEDYSGIAFTNDASHGKMTLTARGGNEKKNDDQYSFSGSLANDAKGPFELGKADGTNFAFMTSKFPAVPQFNCSTGAYDITAMPLKGGFVQGTFSANCDAPSPDGERLDHYTLTGSFKLLRQM